MWNSHEELRRSIKSGMKAKSTVLYIHQDAKQLRRGQSFLKKSGYTVLSAASGRPALRLLASRTVHAVVLDDGVLREQCAVADSIKDGKPSLPIIMMAGLIRLPQSSLISVDALVAKADPPEFLLATLHFLLNAQRGPRARRKKRNKKAPLVYPDIQSGVSPAGLR